MNTLSMKRFLVLSVLILALIFPLRSSDNSVRQTAPGKYLYKVTFVRAAPGKLIELIDLYKMWLPLQDSFGDEAPFWWRHTQGDQWDLMLLFPMASYGEYYSEKRVKTRSRTDLNLSQPKFIEKFREYSAWHEDIFVLGPPLGQVRSAFAGTAYYHVEMFISLPGKHEALFRERVMENRYQVGVGRPENMIFVRDQGAAWDLFTLGCYRDLGHWASSEDIPRETKQAAARKAGFENADQIGPYMRSLITMHRDTMGVAIK